MIIQVDEAKQKLFRDAYFGIGGFANGAYLVHPSSESEERFDYRQSVAMYSNYYQMSVDSNLVDIFAGVERGLFQDNNKVDNKIYAQWAENCDGNGTTFEDFIENAFIDGDYTGWVVVYQDAPEIVASNRLGLEQGEGLPFLNKLTPSDIVEYELNGELNLNYFAYAYFDNNSDIKYNAYFDNKIYKDVELVGLKGSITEALAGKEGFDIPFKPIVITTSLSSNPYTLPDPSYSTIARNSRTLYQVESLIQFQALQTSLSILMYPGKIPEGGISFNENTILEYDAESNNVPEFKAPTNTMERLQQEAERIKVGMLMQANLSILLTDSGASGDAKKWSDGLRMQGLKNKSGIAQRIDSKINRQILDTFKLSPDLYVANYPKDFESMTVTQSLEDYQLLLDMNPSVENTTLIVTNAMLEKFSGSTGMVKQQIIASESSNRAREVENGDDED